MDRWVDYTPEEHLLAGLLRSWALVSLALAAILLIAPYLFSSSVLFIAPPFFVSNSIAGLLLMAFLAWLSAGDVRRFRAMIYVMVGGLLIGAAAYLSMYLANRTGPQTLMLLIAFAVSIMAALLIAGVTSQTAVAQAPWLPWIPDKPFSIWERITQVALCLFGVGSLGAVFVSILAPYKSASDLLLVNPFMVAGSSMKIGLLGLCALLVAADVRRYVHYTQMITALVIGHAGSLVVITLMAIFGIGRFGDYTLVVGAGLSFGSDQMMLGAWLLDVVLIAAFLFLNDRIDRALLDYIGFFSASQFRALEAIAETLIAGDTGEVIPPYQIVLRTDSYLKSFESKRLFLARLAVMGLQLSPIIWGQPALNYMHPSARKNYIDRRFKREILAPNPLYGFLDRVLALVNGITLRLQGRPAKDLSAALSFVGLMDAMMRFNMQLTYMGYYGDPRVWKKTDDGKGIGYTPFSRREKDFDVSPRRPHPALNVMTPAVLERQGIDRITDADVVIIGSGAAGATLAEQLLEQGRRVLILEKGRYVPPDEFSEDEIEMIGSLYADGALQLSQALRFTILQGSCVGGTTVVNNAVCFDTPQRVIDAWNSRGNSAAINSDAFHAAQAAVRQRMRIQQISAGTRQPLDGGVLNHGDGMITHAVEQYFGENGYQYDVVDANIVDCLGCGYCNIGCKYGRKLSMLDEVLPSAQAKYGSEQFRIISEANVTRLEESGGQISRIVAETRGKRKLIIDQPKTVILSAGTIASSWLMMQSGIGKRHNLPVGRGLCFNMGSPLHALFDHELNSFDGLQISHYLEVEGHNGFVYETWYNPPVAQALAMPGWLDTHFQNMLNYNRMAGVGVLVGTEPTAYIVPALITRGPDIVFQPTANDMKQLVDALVMLGDIFLAGGALEVYASTRKYETYRNDAAIFRAQSELDRLRELVQHDYDILLGTGHPQGGNAIGVSPENSVVGPDFKVFGYKNLYVCDASVHPSATTVNPQLTVMAMARYAAQQMAM